MAENKLDAAKRRITALLDRADHPNTEEHEAAACREKAEKMMADYRIERAMLHLKGHDKRRFEVKEFKYNEVPYFASTAFLYVFKHTNCYSAYSEGGRTVVGYPEDIFYGQTLFERAKKEVQDTLYPVWNDSESIQKNVYRFRHSGMAWEDILWRMPREAKIDRGITEDHSGYKKLNYLFRKEEAARGDEKFIWRRSKEDFEVAFKDGFDSRLYARLSDLRARAAAEPTEGEYAVALLNDDEALREEFYQMFPHYRPRSAEDREKDRAAAEAAAEAERQRRAKLTDKQRAAEDEKERRRAEKIERDYQRYLERKRKSQAAWAQGMKSADKVRLRLDDEMKNNDKFLNA